MAPEREGWSGGGATTMAAAALIDPARLVHVTKSYLATLHKTLDATDGALLEAPGFAAAFGAAGAECLGQGSDGLVAIAAEELGA